MKMSLKDIGKKGNLFLRKIKSEYFKKIHSNLKLSCKSIARFFLISNVKREFKSRDNITLIWKITVK